MNKLAIKLSLLAVLCASPAFASGQWTAAGVILSSVTSKPSAILPTGVPNPPSGSWSMTIDDEFTSDSGINTSLWNGGAGAPSGLGGYFPLLHPAGSTCGWAPSDIEDCLGYAGLDSAGQEDGNVFTGNSVSPAGLASTANYNNSNTGPYNGQTWVSLQNYGIMHLGPGSFIEWKAKLPTDASGEGDGLHTDLWCTSSARTELNSGANSDELDIAEHVMGTSGANHNTQIASVFDGLNVPLQNYTYSASGSPDLTSTYATYGLEWMSGGGSQGQVQMFVNGNPIFSAPIALSDAGWSSGEGTYCFANFVQPDASTGFYASTWAGNNGSFTDSSTSNSDPFMVQYFRYWTQH